MPRRSARRATPAVAAHAGTPTSGRRARFQRAVTALCALGLASAFWAPPLPAAASPPTAPAHHAALGPLAQSALSAAAHGRHLPTAWVKGRATKRGTTYGVFLRGATTAKAITATGATPGTVLSVGATADATLGQLALLAALPGITEVELAGQATRQLDVSVPEIHAAEPGHASTAGVPHLWSGTGGSDGPYVSTQGGKVVWQDGQGGSRCCSGDVRVPVLARGSVYIRQTQTGNETVVATNGQQVGTFTSTTAPAFDSNEMFTVSGGVLTATGSSNWTYSGDGTPNSAPVTAPIVVNATVYVGAASGKVYALPEAGNGLAVNTPTWIGNAGAPILAPVDDIQGQEDVAPPTLTGGLAVGGGMLIVPATGTITAFGDTTVTASPDVVTSYQIDQAHDGDQPSDSLTAPLAAAPKWSVTLGASVSNPMIANGLVYVIADATVVPPQIDGATTLYALNERNGSIAWQVSLGYSDDSGLGYDDGRVFTETAPTGGNVFNAYDATTGTLDWTLAPSPYIRATAPVAMNGIAYFESNLGGITATLTGYNELTGAAVQSSTFSTGDIAPPAVSDTGVYSGGDDLFVDDAASIISPAVAPTFSGDAGQSTVVGVVDTGIDLANADFQTNSGTRIVDLWDQAACPNPSGNTCPTQPPNSQGFNYGAECASAAIDAANCGPFSYSSVNGGDACNSPVGLPGASVVSLAEMDCDGHGTHVTGIAAGNGRAAPFGTYIGVAPQADLVIVKSDFDLAHVVDGVAYIFKVASARGEPASVNISLGTNEGPHDGSDMFETMLDALTGPGRLVSVAGGNESTGSPYYHYHASGTVGNGQVRTDGLVVQSLPVFLDLWYPGADSISAAVAETGNGQTPWVAPDTTGVSGEDGTCTQPTPGTDEFTDQYNNIIEILSCTHMPSNGMNEIQVALFNLNNGGDNLDSPVDGHGCSDTNACFDDFKLLLRGNGTPTGSYNAWTFDQSDYFFYDGDGNDNSTLNEPASAHDVISVGSDISRNSWPSEAGNETESATIGAISDFSGHGPTLDGRNGIDLVAPGEEIGSSLSADAGPITTDCPAGTTQGCTSPDGNHLFLQGTSMAAPHVTGAIALLLEQVPTINVAQAKSLLAQSADTSPLTSGGSVTTWGAGKLLVGPGVLTVTPATGPLAGGTTIHITGVDLQSGMSMSLGGQPLTLTSTGTNAFSATVPASAEPGALTLTMRNPDGSTAVDPSAYTYVDPTAYHSLTPFRTCDTRSAAAIAANQCKGKTLRGGGTVTVQVTGGAVPSGARSVAVNLTASNNSSTGPYVTAYPAGHTLPRASNLNLAGHGVATNLAIVQLSTAGAITIYNALGSVDVIVDVEGYFATPTGSGTVAGEFHSIPPLRICDTRGGQRTECAGATSSPLAGGTWRDVVLSGLPSGAPAGTPSIPADGTAAAAVFNLTATQGTAGTFLAVAPPNASDQCPSRPLASNVNPAAGVTLPNRVISPLGPRHDVCVFNSVGAIDFIIDVDGWFGTGAETSTGALFNSIAPTRLCDTRSGSGTECSGWALGANASRPIISAGVGQVPDMGVASPPLAVVVNLTAVAGSAPTYFTLYPSDVVSRPTASDLNPVAGETIANLSIVGTAQSGLDDGDVSLYNAAGTINAILDVAGWFQ